MPGKKVPKIPMNLTTKLKKHAEKQAMKAINKHAEKLNKKVNRATQKVNGAINKVNKTKGKVVKRVNSAKQAGKQISDIAKAQFV